MKATADSYPERCMGLPVELIIIEVPIHHIKT